MLLIPSFIRSKSSSKLAFVQCNFPLFHCTKNEINLHRGASTGPNYLSGPTYAFIIQTRTWDSILHSSKFNPILLIKKAVPVLALTARLWHSSYVFPHSITATRKKDLYGTEVTYNYAGICIKILIGTRKIK